MADDKVETKTEAKAKVKPETKAEVKTETKAEVKTEPKVETKVETKPEIKAEAKVEEKAKAGAKAKESFLTVTLVKSGIGYNIKQKQTLIGLGLTRMHKTKTLKDTPPIRGMINKVSHLVKVHEPGTE